MKFLVRIRVDLPTDLDSVERERLFRAESDRGLELMRMNKLLDIWRLPGQPANISLYDTTSATELHELLTSLPLWPWLRIDVEALAEHPLAVRRDSEIS